MLHYWNFRIRRVPGSDTWRREYLSAIGVPQQTHDIAESSTRQKVGTWQRLSLLGAKVLPHGSSGGEWQHGRGGTALPRAMLGKAPALITLLLRICTVTMNLHMFRIENVHSGSPYSNEWIQTLFINLWSLFDIFPFFNLYHFSKSTICFWNFRKLRWSWDICTSMMPQKT